MYRSPGTCGGVVAAGPPSDGGVAGGRIKRMVCAVSGVGVSGGVVGAQSGAGVSGGVDGAQSGAGGFDGEFGGGPSSPISSANLPEIGVGPATPAVDCDFAHNLRATNSHEED